MDILQRTARHERLTMTALLRTLLVRLWRPSEDHAQIAMRGGVLAAAAGNRHGVPCTGAVQCVRALLTLPQDATELSRARIRAARFETDRAVVLALLDGHHTAPCWPKDDPAVLRVMKVDLRRRPSLRPVTADLLAGALRHEEITLS